MDRISVRQRARRHPLPAWSSSLRLRYERERLELQKRVREQLVSDVFGLYEKSLFVDLKLEASRGNVYCHQLFFAARVPAVWRLLQEIAKYQYCGRKPAKDLICIQLPDVEYKELQKFTRSLYTEENSRAAGAALRRKLEGVLLVLQQRALLHRSQIRIEKLSHDEEQRVQRLILEQLRLGHLSEKKGNVREVGRRPPCHDAPHQRILHSGTPSDNADPCILPTAALLKGDSPTQESVRPKSSQRVAARRSELPMQTMNVTDHSVSGLAQCSAKDGSRAGISNCNSVEDNLDNHTVQTRNGKIPRKGSITLTKRSPPLDDASPGAPLSSQESPVFNVCMIKELQTSPMQVSGESLQERLKDKKETSPQASLRSSYSETTPVADLDQPSGGAVIYSNGDATASPTGGRGSKERRPLRYGAMFSTKENAFLHQADMFARQQHQAGPSLTLAKHCLPRKCQSFGAESQDNADMENTSASNSGSEHRLRNLHETSSLEVELPSSHEDNSSSHDSEGSPVAVGKKWQSENPEGKRGHDGRSERNRNWLREQEREREVPSPPVDSLKPLVRARTFEVLEGAVDGSPCEIRAEPRSRTGRGLKHERSEHSGGCVATNSPKRNRAGQERKVSDESVPAPFQDGAEDPERLRELERKKGSLIFEHNFQTYSNIPSANMMTASMMTASLTSESGSIGMSGSLYSSMVDSALLGSIHSLGALEATTADPVPRPASVGLPVMHSTDELGVGSPHPSRHPIPRSQRSTEAMEMQQQITEKEEATQTPSPDSLSVDLVAKRNAETASRTVISWMEGSTTSINKEEMDDEEKERDEQEAEGRLGNSSNEPKVERRDLPTEESFVLRTFSGSPRLSRDLSENTPIMSGGSTLKREKDSAGEKKSLAKCERQVSIGSVKDVDSIPLVFGYIGPQDDDEEEGRKEGQAKGEDGGETSKDKDEEKHQSIFPMFIDLKDIPSPSEEPKAAEKEAGSRPKGPSSAVYMYIEADAPSPKTRRKRRSESDGAAVVRISECQPQEFSSLPPVLTEAPDVNRVENATRKVLEKREDHKGVREDCKEGRQGKEGKEGKEKKGFFMFIEAESSSKSGSPKSKRRPAAPPPAKKRPESAMTRSAPSDSILFSSPDASRLMTKSVIGREEFIAQPPARINVSLNDKINESSASGKDGTFVSGIPRPIHSLRAARSSSKAGKGRLSTHKLDTAPRQRDASATRAKDEVTTSEANDPATSRDISLSELGPTQSSSLGEAAPSSKAQEDVEDEEAVSDVSSLLSSLDRSNNPSEQGSSEHKSKLGEDLLQMFLNEVNTDVTIQIGEKHIPAHKCILASRCVYFAAMLSGHWVETAGNVIKLQGFSPESVMVALKHIYSGTSKVPEGVRVGELAALADMLALDGLKDVIALHLKAKMCHYFHKPCSGCLEGVLDVLPIAGAYCLDELYHRCLRWVARHFVVVLPTRNYAALPPEVQDRCLKQLLDDMSVSNVLETALGCERVLSSLPMVRWAQPVFDSAAQLLESATSFIAANMSGVLASDRFVALGRDSGWSIESLQDTMRVACELIRPDQAVLSHLQLSQLLQDNQEEEAPEVSETYVTFLETLLSQVEKFMVHNANRVAVCRKWPMLSTATQRRIKDAALVVVEFTRPTGHRPKLSSTNRRPRGSSSEGNRTPGRLMRSASATAVPSTQRPGSTRRTPGGGPEPGRCQTPPASLTRPRTHTPPPTRASTLRAQARQVAIQRSQSARSVAERPRRIRPGNDTSTDEEVQSTNKRTIPTGSFTRGATFTRSLSRPDTSSSRPLPHTPSRSAGPPPSSRPRTPGPLEGSQLPRRTSALQRTPSQTTTGSSASEDEIPHRKSSHTQRSQSLTPVHRGGDDQLARTQSSEMRCRTPTQQRTELRSSTNSLSRSGGSTAINNLSRTGGGSINNLSRTGAGSANNLSRTGNGSSTNNLSKAGGGSNSLSRSAGTAALQENRPVPHSQPEGNSHSPRTPRDSRKQVDVKNGNLARPRVAAQGRRSTRSPLRESGRATGLGAGRGSSPTSSIHLSFEGRSRASSVTSRPGGVAGTITATPPSVGSRSNTFCKDDNTNVTKKTALP